MLTLPDYFFRVLGLRQTRAAPPDTDDFMALNKRTNTFHKRVKATSHLLPKFIVYVKVHHHFNLKEIVLSEESPERQYKAPRPSGVAIRSHLDVCCIWGKCFIFSIIMHTCIITNCGLSLCTNAAVQENSLDSLILYFHTTGSGESL